jgi:hypothetical protein
VKYTAVQDFEERNIEKQHLLTLQIYFSKRQPIKSTDRRSVKKLPTPSQALKKFDNTLCHQCNNNNNNNNNNNTIIPVIIGAMGTVTRSLRKKLEAVPGKHSIDSLQKTAIHGTSHIIRKVLQCEA